MKHPDGKYEVLKNPSAPSIVTDIKSPTSPEFSVVNSNGVKITLKQCSPPQNSNAKKPKVISDVLLRCGQMEKDAPSSSALIQQLQQQQQDKDKFITTNPILPDKLEKQRRKVTFSVDRSSTSESKTSPTSASGTVPKTALKKPAEQQDKKQFLQGFQLTAREPSMPNDSKLIPTIRDIGATMNALKSLQKNNAKVEESSKKDTDEVKKKSNTENAGSNGNTIATNATVAKRNLSGTPASARTYAKLNDANGRAFNSGIGPNSTNIPSGNHAKMDVYTFSSDPPILPAGAVKRKCPPGLPITELKRRRSPLVAQRQEANKRQNVSPHNSPHKLPRTSSAEHVIPTSRATSNITGDYGGSSSRVSNAKASTSPLLPNDTRDFLVDGYGLNIPASLSITLTSPKSPGTSGQFVETKDPSDNGRGKVALGKVNPSITLNDRSVDPRVLKALKTGQIRMPASPTKAGKPTAATVAATTKQMTPPMTTDRSEKPATNQQRTTTFAGKRKKEHELSRDILDLSGGKKNMDLHPLRIPQPVTKLNQNKTNKITGRDHMQPGSISDQGQVVTLMGGHRYYRAPPGSLTPAAHRVSDFALPPSRTPVYAPCLGSINRSSSDIASVFPSLSSLYALNQAPNLQQFQMDTARLKLPPRPVVESGGATSATSPGSGDNPANPGISGVPSSGKSHLAAQCAPVKPARSSVAPLAVPINKQQQPADKSANVNANVNANRTILGDSGKPPAFRNNEGHVSADETPRLNVQKRFSLGVESTNNRFLPRNEDAKGQVTNETARDANAEPRKETINPDNSTQSQQQRQQQQNREAASPNIVSSTASPSPPPGGRNEGNTNHGDNNVNSSNGSNNATSSSTTKSVASEATCNKSPDSPDSSSITVECSSGTSSAKTTAMTTTAMTTTTTTTTDRETSTDATKTTTTTTTSDANPIVVDNDSTTASDDRNKFPMKSEVSEIAKQLTSVQKTLLAVFPSNEWANNPIAAEHLGNFLKSLNATIKSEGNADESKGERTDRKGTEGNENR
ncbi:polycomb group protein psc [Lasius niger]|uniref:Polycomb group protein psc n=1 Tax=Lasius niger TaxID=67767 RepID=A0A0J7KUT2_LASNI|nr:polycomb group protein psc [Lasius niger]